MKSNGLVSGMVGSSWVGMFIRLTSFDIYWCRLGFESLIGDVLVDPACLGRSL